MTIDDGKDTRWDDEDFDDFGEVDVEWYPIPPGLREDEDEDEDAPQATRGSRLCNGLSTSLAPSTTSTAPK